MTSTDLIEIFCILDEFCKYFEPELRRHTLETPGKRHRDRCFVHQGHGRNRPV